MLVHGKDIMCAINESGLATTALQYTIVCMLWVLSRTEISSLGSIAIIMSPIYPFHQFFSAVKAHVMHPHYLTPYYPRCMYFTSVSMSSYDCEDG